MTDPLFIVPAFNEEGNIGDVVHDLRAHFPEAHVVVVSDGSSDRTAEVARDLGVTALELPFNLGIGATVQTGFIYAMNHGYGRAVQFDGDGQHDASEVRSLLERLDRGDCDVVIGSRFLRPTGYESTPARRLGMVLISLVNWLLLRRWFSDNTSGFRAFNERAIAYLAQDYPHDYPEPESIVTLSRLGFRIVEVSTRMQQRRRGLSSITLSRSIYYMAKVLLAIAIGVTRPVEGVDRK